MTLEDRIVAALQAIGADIKALLSRGATIMRTSAAQAITGTTLVNVTGLSATVVANTTYRVTGRVLFQSSGLTAGVTAAFAGPTGSDGQLIIGVPTTALISTGTPMMRTTGSSGSATTTSVVAVATTMVATFDGILTVGATAGTFALRFASSGTAATATVMAGSTLVVERLS